MSFSSWGYLNEIMFQSGCNVPNSLYLYLYLKNFMLCGVILYPIQNSDRRETIQAFETKVIKQQL